MAAVEAILDAYGREIVETPSHIMRQMRLAVADFRRELHNFETERSKPKATELEILDERYNAGNLFNAAAIFSYPQESQYGPSAAVSGPITLAMANNYVPVSLNRILLSYAYMTNGFVKTLVREPIDDAFKGGWEYKSHELDPDQKAMLKREVMRIRPRREMRRASGTLGAKVQYNAGNDLQRSHISAIKFTGYWGRLYGGSGLLLNVPQNPMAEFNIDLIDEETPVQLIPCDRWELLLDTTTLFSGVKCPYNYYGYPVNESRVIRFLNNEAPSFIRQRVQGWGMSEIEQCIRPINAYLKLENVKFELLDQAKTDVYRLKNMAGTKASGKANQALFQAMQAVNQIKNYHNAVVLDVEDEYQQKQISFSGIPEIMAEQRMDLAAALRFPLTKLFGDSATGFGGGQDAMENYNSVVAGARESMEPMLIEVGNIDCQKLFGAVPEDLEVEWKPLRELSGPDAATVDDAKANRVFGMLDRDLMDGKEASEQLRDEGILKVDTQVIQGKREAISPAMQQQEMQQEHEEGMQQQAGKQAEKLAKMKPKPGAKPGGKK